MGHNSALFLLIKIEWMPDFGMCCAPHIPKSGSSNFRMSSMFIFATGGWNG